MPIYEFQCEQCQKIFEELVFNDSQPACPHCGSENTHKLMSCCAHQNSGGAGMGHESSGSSHSGCSGCSGGNCASCGH